MKLIRKIKRFLGLELPYLLEEEEIENKTTSNNRLNNSIVAIPKNTEVQFYKSENWKNISEAMYRSGITMNEAREMMKKMKGD